MALALERSAGLECAYGLRRDHEVHLLQTPDQVLGTLSLRSDVARVWVSKHLAGLSGQLDKPGHRKDAGQ